MVASAGRAIRIAFDPGTGAVDIVGSTSDNFEITKEGIVVTDKDDEGVVTMLDDAVGTWSMTGGVEGILKDTTILALANDATQMTYDMEIKVAGLGTYSGKFAITQFSVEGADGAEPATFSMQIASSGAITFA